MMTLYDYWRSSAAYRVRIALNLKGVAYEQRSVDLVAGEQMDEAYRAGVNAQGLVPTLMSGADPITQSLAIIEYLEETIPEPAFLPSDPLDRARVRSLAQAVACDIHPLNNLRVLKYLKGTLGQDQDAVSAWYRHWVENGFAALEARIKGDGLEGAFLSGEGPGLADICLVPQMYNARRFDVDLSACPALVRIDEACRALEPFKRAAPENQPDAIG